jgi:hypothetical protein
MLSACAITFLIAEVGRTLARWSKETLAKPIVPSLEMRLRLRLEGADHAADVWEAGEARQHRRHDRADARVSQLAAARLEDDLVEVAGLGREAAFQQVGGALAARVAEREVARVVAADPLPGGPDAGQDSDPQ